jgi:alanine dehydrogenase
VRRMRRGAAIIDVSIDQGGCVETSHPTTLRDPTYVEHGVIHYCVPNFTALVARTASRALSNVLRSYLVRLAAAADAARTDDELRSALMVYRGQVVDPQLGAAQGLPVVTLEEMA